MLGKRSVQSLIVFILLISILFCAIGASAASQETGALADTGDVTCRYTQAGYYQPPYLFEIGWNLTQAASQGYEAREITLTSGAALPVLFGDECKSALEDDEAMAALASLLSRLHALASGGDFPITRPLVVSAQYVGDRDVKQLASDYDAAGALPQFAAVFAWLDDEGQLAYLDRFYDQGRIAFFAACLDPLEEGGPWLDDYAQRTYEDDSISFFAVLAGHMDAPRLDLWRERAQADRRTNVLAVVEDAQKGAEQTAAGAQEADIFRLRIEELPESVIKAMDQCAIKTWYLIRYGQRQYLYYNGLAWNYGWQPQLQGNCLSIKIVPLTKKDHGYVLISAPAKVALSVSYNGETVALTALQAPG